MQRLKQIYQENVIPKLNNRFNYSHSQKVPKLLKIVINRGFSESFQNAKILESSLNELTNIAGQKGIVTNAKRAVASFKIREGVPVGMKVTLRGEKMYSFLDRFINLALPRVRDFQGLDKTFDGSGNYSTGFSEQFLFPEVDFDKVNQAQGMDITIVTSCSTDKEGLALLEELGMPFKKKK
jgi:large subunit ribosomal protein L5|uniref:Ribosomal protein L5 n=1 Tax=Eutreptiella gymnastica TaxID=73025 RepID=I0J3K7_9EUGL|nr:ribosomal protein L5 [Eutreptiella gymnastica]CCE26480.1 ribosomal protein L5 [Eutreptiella gymnastica]|tara:strand:- start:3908 stop:4450 length:543 start_codon:yes stop_codon:yes gene_type:complete